MCKVWTLRLLYFLRYRGAKKFELGPLGPLAFVLGAKMVVGFHPCNMPHKCGKFGPRGYFSFWVTGEQRNVVRRRWRRKLDDSRTSMPALARPCTSGVETSKHMQVTCWHCGCWDHYECVDNQYLSPYRTGGKWLPWFLRKRRPFIFKYRPLAPTYFNIWGIFTIVGIFLIKWYNIPLMQFASLTLEGAHP